MEKSVDIVKMPATYKLVVPLDVEKKIRYLLRKYPSTEWSGVLFYTHEGNFEDNNLVMTCVDIYPMDLGTAVFTSFNVNEDVAHYIAENIELFNCDLGIIHSHHNMSSGFSGTDIATLKEEGSERNCVLSLIVNNEGTYSAAITRMVKTDYNITVHKLGTSYELFGEGTVHKNIDSTSTVKCVTKEIVQYFMLDIDREVYNNPYDYLDDRFKEIIDSRKRDIEKNINTSTDDNYLPDFNSWRKYYKNKPENSKELPEFYKKTENTEEPRQLYLFGEDYDDDIAMDAAVKIVTCSVLNDSIYTDLSYYVNHVMDKEYKVEFDNPKSDLFYAWKEFIVSYVLDYVECSNMEAFAANICKILSEYKDNPYIKEYCDELKQYC